MKATCALGPSTALAIDESPAFARRGEPGADVKERAFAAAARPDQRNDFAVGDGEADVLDGREAAAVARKRMVTSVVFKPYKSDMRRLNRPVRVGLAAYSPGSVE